jgi:hypothetical protein
MRKSITLLFVLAFVTVGVASLWAQEQTIYQLQSRDTGEFDPDLMDFCISKVPDIPIPGLPVVVTPLIAEFWSFRTRAKDGEVKNEFVRRVGETEGCSYVVMVDVGQFRISIYGSSVIGDLAFEGWGECDFPMQLEGMPTPSSSIGTCTTILEADPSLGIAGGMATSNSVAGPDVTGSFWTFRIVWE